MKQLQSRLQNLLYSSSAESQPAVAEVLDYFMKRLGSPQSSTRRLASNVSRNNNNNNNNTSIYKAHIVSIRAESEAPAVVGWRGWLVVVV